MGLEAKRRRSSRTLLMVGTRGLPSSWRPRAQEVAPRPAYVGTEAAAALQQPIPEGQEVHILQALSD